jgi:pyruvate,water dikinase
VSLGSKAQGLIDLREQYGAMVPEFVVLPLAEIVQGGADALAKSSTASELVLDAVAVERLLAPASAWPLSAVRTSALAEDTPEHSFAGLYETVLDVAPTGLADAVAQCVRSLTGERVLAYAAARQITQLPLGGSVVVQRMVHGRIAGVMFTQTGAGALEVAYSSAGPDAVVRGEAASTYRLPAVEALPKRAPVPVRLLQIGRELQARRGPTDVEFAATGSRVWLLQARPITAPDRTSTLAWDSTNIGENYPGVTLPLTYSFIRDVYAQVYPAFFRLLGRSDRALRTHDRVFRNTLGYVNGRVHYQIDNWFEMAAMLPGGKANQEFFAAMLQPVKEGEVRAKPRPTVRGALALAVGGVRLVWLLGTSERRSRRFAKVYRERYARYRAIDFDSLAPDAALSALGHIRTDLLALWAVPILNDVRLMVFHGLLRRTFGPERHADYLAFLTGLTDRASLAPLTALTALGKELRDGGATDAHAPLTPSQRALVAEYLDIHGGRAPDELQLENPRLGDDMGQLVALALHAAEAPVRPQPAARVRGTLRQRILGKHVRRAIDHRERFRYQRAQVFGIARDVYVSVGERLAADAVIATRDDVFWLTVEELEGAVFGHAWDHDLTGLVAMRKARLEHYTPPLASRRVVGAGAIAPLHLSFPGAPEPGALTGMGVAPGRYTGEILVLAEFDADADVRGKVLVTSHVDPGWTLLFVAAGAIITERGNPLSHVAIIGRELGIPVIVAAAGAMEALVTGHFVTMDGTTGEIVMGESNA